MKIPAILDIPTLQEIPAIMKIPSILEIPSILDIPTILEKTSILEIFAMQRLIEFVTDQLLEMHTHLKRVAYKYHFLFFF